MSTLKKKKCINNKIINYILAKKSILMFGNLSVLAQNIDKIIYSVVY